MRDSFSSVLNVQRIHHHPLPPLIPQVPRDLLRRLLARHRTHHIQRGIQPRRPRIARNHPEPAQPQLRAPRRAILLQIALPPAVAALARDAAPPPLLLAAQHLQIPAVDDERVLLLIPEVEPRVVHHVHLLHDLGAVRRRERRRLLAQLLELDVQLRVRRRGEALQDAGPGEEHGAGTDAQQRALLDRVVLLHVGEGADQLDGLVVLVDAHDGGGRAAGDDEDVDVAQELVRVLEVHVRGDGVALRGLDGLGRRGGDADEGALVRFFGFVEGGLQDFERPRIFEEVDAVADVGGSMAC